MPGGIFISYRREDAPSAAGRLCDHLLRHFPKEQVFFDVDRIDIGVDFVKVLNQHIAECDVLLVIMGKNWLVRRPDGKLRLSMAEDFVRIEVEAALSRNIPVVPVLVDGGQIPSSRVLPKSLKSLATRQAIEIDHATFVADAERLVAALRKLFERNGSVSRTDKSVLPDTDVSQAEPDVSISDTVGPAARVPDPPKAAPAAPEPIEQVPPTRAEPATSPPAREPVEDARPSAAAVDPSAEAMRAEPLIERHTGAVSGTLPIAELGETSHADARSSSGWPMTLSQWLATAIYPMTVLLMRATYTWGWVDSAFRPILILGVLFAVVLGVILYRHLARREPLPTFELATSAAISSALIFWWAVGNPDLYSVLVTCLEIVCLIVIVQTKNKKLISKTICYGIIFGFYGYIASKVSMTWVNIQFMNFNETYAIADLIYVVAYLVGIAMLLYLVIHNARASRSVASV